MNKKSIANLFTVIVFVFPVLFSVVPQKAEAVTVYTCCCYYNVPGDAGNWQSVWDTPGKTEMPPNTDLSKACPPSYRACPDNSCFNIIQIPTPSAATMKKFYDLYYNSMSPTWSYVTSSLIPGSSGEEVLTLSVILEGFGFYPEITYSGTSSTLEKSYGAKLTQAVSDLQGALDLPITGNFDPTTREAFATFYYDISNPLLSPYQDTEKLALIYPGGVTSFFNGTRFDKPLFHNSFSVSEPTLIVQDSSGANFVWKNNKWELTENTFPTPKATGGKGFTTTSNTGNILKPLSVFSNKLFDIFYNSKNPTTESYNPSSDIFSIFSLSNIGVFEKFFGTTNNNTFDTTDSSVFSSFSQRFNLAVSKLPINTTSLQVRGINNTVGVFDPSTGTFRGPEGDKIKCPAGEYQCTLDFCCKIKSPLSN